MKFYLVIPLYNAIGLVMWGNEPSKEWREKVLRVFFKTAKKIENYISILRMKRNCFTKYL